MSILPHLSIVYQLSNLILISLQYILPRVWFHAPSLHPDTCICRGLLPLNPTFVIHSEELSLLAQVCGEVSIILRDFPCFVYILTFPAGKWFIWCRGSIAGDIPQRGGPFRHADHVPHIAMTTLRRDSIRAPSWMRKTFVLCAALSFSSEWCVWSGFGSHFLSIHVRVLGLCSELSWLLKEIA